MIFQFELYSNIGSIPKKLYFHLYERNYFFEEVPGLCNFMILRYLLSSLFSRRVPPTQAEYFLGPSRLFSVLIFPERAVAIDHFFFRASSDIKNSIILYLGIYAITWCLA